MKPPPHPTTNQFSPSKIHQPSINQASTKHQPSINQASTKHQKSINQAYQ
jgi:hypothetical protein